ncbi:hypothetical protein [Methylorubrum populi]
MSDPNPTVGELFKAKAVTDDQVNAAVDAYLADTTTASYPIADHHSLDLAAAVLAHEWASQVTALVGSSVGLKRSAVRTAFLAARTKVV